MLGQKTIEALALASGITVEALTKAIKSESEEALEVKTPFKTFNNEDWTRYETNIQTEKDAEYNKGKEVGSGRVIADLKEKVGLDYDGKKPEMFIEKFKEYLVSEATLKPNERVKELENDLKLLKEIELPKRDQAIKEKAAELLGYKVDTKIKSVIPDALPEGLTKEDALTLAKSNLSFSFDEDGKEVVMRGGQVLKNQMRENVNHEAALNDFIIERKWNVQSGGRGGKDDTGSGGKSQLETIRSESGLQKYFAENKIHPSGQDARALRDQVNKAAKDSGDKFDYEA